MASQAISGSGQGTLTFTVPVITNFGIPGARGDGVTDDSQAIVAAANLYSELWLPEGSRFFIGSSITVSADLRFIAGAQFIIGTGVTLTLGGQVNAPLVQCFVIQGTGSLNLGTKNSLVPAEWFGARGDWNGTTGTDNRTAMQNCLNSIRSGQMLLQALDYLVSGEIVIRRGVVGIRGTTYGLKSLVNLGHLAANLPVSRIVCNSASANVVTLEGVVSQDPDWAASSGYNMFEYFSIDRLVAPTGTASGLSIIRAGGWVINHVISSDHIRCFYLRQSTGSYGLGFMANSLGVWGLGGFEYTGTLYGIFHEGLNCNTVAPGAPCGYGGVSFRCRDCHVANHLDIGRLNPTTYGFYISGNQINDLMFNNFETAKLSYGIYIRHNPVGIFAGDSDIHILNTIADEIVVAGIHLEGIRNQTGGCVSIRGGWFCGWRGNNNTGIVIQNCYGVSVVDCQVLNYIDAGPGMSRGITVTGSRSITVQACNIIGQRQWLLRIDDCDLSTFGGNVLAGAGNQAVPVFIQVTNTNRTALQANTISGTGTTGISLDSNCINNYIMGINLINPANITTPISDSGSNNIKQ